MGSASNFDPMLINIRPFLKTGFEKISALRAGRNFSPLKCMGTGYFLFVKDRPGQIFR